MHINRVRRQLVVGPVEHRPRPEPGQLGRRSRQRFIHDTTIAQTHDISEAPTERRRHLKPLWHKQSTTSGLAVRARPTAPIAHRDRGEHSADRAQRSLGTQWPTSHKQAARTAVRSVPQTARRAAMTLRRPGAAQITQRPADDHGDLEWTILALRQITSSTLANARRGRFDLATPTSFANDAEQGDTASVRPPRKLSHNGRTCFTVITGASHDDHRCAAQR